jgi:hypothetical protein
MPPTLRPSLTTARICTAFGCEPVPLAAALSLGITPDQLRAAVERGLLVRVRRGWYAVAAPIAERDPWAEREHAVAAHLRLLRRVLADQPAGTYGSHETAAYAHGQATPRWSVPDVVSLVRPGAVDHCGPGYRVRGSAVQDTDVAEVDGLLVTSLERTAIDLSRGCSPTDVLVALDSAARLRVAASTGTSGNELRHAVLLPDVRAEAQRLLDAAYRRCFGWPGTVVVRDHLALVDPASESSLESRSRGWFWDAGLRRLRIGQPIAVGASTYWADFLDEEHRIVGEADGWGKYGTDLRTQREAWDAERARQGELEADGYRVVRWTSSDARLAVLNRWWRALNRPM